MKKGELTLMVLAEYSKAFYTVSYSAIIQKMCRMGFSKPFLSWMTNYLCDYCHSVFSPLPRYLLKRLQKIEFAAASFVYGRYVNDIGETLKLNWLPAEERRDFNLLKLTFRALYFKQWPIYLNLQRVPIRRKLHSSDCIRLQVPLEKRTFQETSAVLYLIIYQRN